MKRPDSIGHLGHLAVLLAVAALPPLAIGQTIPEVPPEIVSAWKAAGENALLVFHHDGTYQMAQDSATEPGMERGTFTWNKVTSAFSATTRIDTNGEAGLSHPAGATTLSISGDTMTYTVVGEGSFILNRVVNTASAIVGSWIIPGDPASVTFLADGTYFSIEEDNDAPFGYDGIERGTYTWDPVSKILTATPVTDTNGDTGLSSLPPGFTVDIVDNAMTASDDGGTTILRRITPIPSPLPPNDFDVDQFSNHRQTSAGAPALLPGPPDDFPFWGEAYIGDSVTGTGGTLTIASQAPRSFVDDGGWGIAVDFSSLTALNAASAFPNGANYVFTRSGGNATLNYPAGGTFPPAPRIQPVDVEDGAWIDGSFVLGQSQILIWSAHANYDPATLFTVLSVVDQETGEELLYESVFQGDISTYDFSGKLTPGASYDVQLEHVKIANSTTAGTGPFAGKRGYALYNSNTRFTMTAADEPSYPPSINEQPSGQSAALGSNVILTVNASGSPTPALQWFKDGEAIVGQTGNSLAIFDLQADDYGNYSVSATNFVDDVTSVIAAITEPSVEVLGINRRKLATQQSASGPVSTGVSFSVYVEGQGLSPDFPSSNMRISKPDSSLVALGFDEDRWGLESVFVSESAMLSSYPNGNYQIRIGPDSVPVSMVGSAYPVQPLVTSSAGTWNAGKLQITASQAAAGFTLTTNASNGDGFATLSIMDPADNSILEAGGPIDPLSPTIEAVIPEYFMTPGTIYQVEVEFDEVIDTEDSSAFSWAAPSPGVTTAFGLLSTTTTLLLEIIPDPFDAWADDFFSPAELANPLISGPDIDFDGDGIPNLTEFLLGGNPKVSSKAVLPVLTTTPIAGGRNLVFSYQRKLAAAGIAEVVVHSADLTSTWVAAIHGQSGVTRVVTPIDTLTEQVVVTIPAIGNRHFVRLGVPGAGVVYTPETSYQNFKGIGLQPQMIPSQVGMNTGTDARAYGDFFGDGSIGLFTATLQYAPWQAISSAAESAFAFWRQQPDGTFVKDTAILSGNSGCLHPRKALVADFNGDGRPDVFVACHGYDAPPYPGERNRIVLSQSDGTYAVTDAAPDVAFFHGATAADLDRDGDVDVIAVQGGFGSQRVFLNRGDGSFVKEPAGRLPAFLDNKNYFSVELLDVNEDTWPDLVVGGHEWEGAPTQVYLNSGSFNFSAVEPIGIPAVAGEGVVLDFVATGTGSQRALWILRSSGGDGTFYESRTIQKVIWSTQQSSVPLQQRPANWIPWLIPMQSGGQNGVGGDDIASGIFLAN